MTLIGYALLAAALVALIHAAALALDEWLRRHR